MMLNHMKLSQWKKVMVISTSLIIISLGILSGIAWSPTPAQRQINFRQGRHKTQALTVVNTTISGDQVKVTLKNVSNKNITGLQMSVNNDRCQVEFLDADEPDHQVLLPGAIYEQWFSLPPASETVEVSLLAVVFEDKTSDGDSELIKEIKETRQGAKKLLIDFMPLLNSALNSSHTDSLSVADRLEAEFRALPSGNESGNIGLGEHKERDEILFEIQKLRRAKQRQAGIDIREALMSVKNRFDNKLTKLE